MSDLETFKELLRGMAEAKSTTELWFKQAAFMLWCGDNPDKLANLIAHPAQPPAQVDARGEVYKATHFLIQQLAELVRLTQPESAKVKWRGTLIDRESVVQIVIRMRDSIDGLNDYFRKHTLAVEPTAQEDES